MPEGRLISIAGLFAFAFSAIPFTAAAQEISGPRGLPSAPTVSLPSASVRFPQKLVVSDVSGLRQAVKSAVPGDQILIAPGRYRTTLQFTARTSGTEDDPIVVTALEGPGTVIIDGGGGAMVIKISAASHIRLDGLDVTGGGYHGVFFDKGSHHITLTNSRIYDNHAQQPMNSHAEVKGSGRSDLRPHHISITNNEIFHETHPEGGNFQGIDCNFCSDFWIAGNYLHDIRNPTEEPYSHYDRGSCIQMKSTSEGTVIEGNRFARCHIGIVYGGEGMASPEHLGGIVRNNLITHSGEIGIAVVNVRGGKVYNNTLIANPESIRIARDVRNPDSENLVDVANNVVGTPIIAVSDAGITLRSNVVVKLEEAAGVFEDIASDNFSPKAGAASLIDKGIDLTGDVPDDYSLTPRPQGSGYDIGAVEYRP